MIKVIPGEIITQFQPAKDIQIMRTEILDAESKEQIDSFEFVSIWTSYKKDQGLPKEKRKLKIKNKLQMKNRKDVMISVTLKRKVGRIERAEFALKRLFVKDGRYELGSISEAVEVLHSTGDNT